MDAKLERIIELTRMLQEAMGDCDDVIGVTLNHATDRMYGNLHVYKPETIGLGPLTACYVDSFGRKWGKTVINGVEIIGTFETEGTSNE